MHITVTLENTRFIAPKDIPAEAEAYVWITVKNSSAGFEETAVVFKQSLLAAKREFNKIHESNEYGYSEIRPQEREYGLYAW